jgi:tetratricopeptide (TPR) repeat protein
MPKKTGNIMTTWNPLTRLAAAVTLGLVLCVTASGQATSRLSTTFLARGEQALLEVSVVMPQTAGIPEIPLPKVPNVAIQLSGRPPQGNRLTARTVEYTFSFIVSSYEVGAYVIPPITVLVDGLPSITEPLDFKVFDPDDLEWSEVQAGSRTFRYASTFLMLNATPFENETTPTEIKVFVPEDLLVEDWGIPDFQRDGVAAWRFQPQPSTLRNRINLLGMRYVSISYPSTITPTRVGKVGIGPAKIRLKIQELVMDPFPRAIIAEAYLQVPKLEFEALPLPPGAPEGFENAVGNFRLTASSSVTEVQEGDPLTIDLVVTGSGNLDTLRPPALEDPSGWKVYGTTTEQRGDERMRLSGNVVFHQSIRPLEMKTEVPPFRLVFFDPREDAYKTITTEPIALKMLPSATSNPAAQATIQTLAMPVERMTDILAILPAAQLTAPVASQLPAWLGHAVGALLALALIAKAAWMRLAPRLRKDPRREVQLRELREIEKAGSADETEFLKASGAFIERWLGVDPPPEVQAVLAERDAVCFRAERPKVTLDQSRRQEILRLLRHSITAIFLLASLGLSHPARAADVATQAREAYEAAKYDEALQHWFGSGKFEQLSADTLYNIGNACYRSGSPGQAALYYRRALARDSGHQEARQNLRFLERKYGSIVVQRPEYQYALAKFPLSTWQAVFWSGAWMCALALLVFPATRQGARLRIAAVAALVLGPIFLSVGILGWRYFPSDAEFAPLARQAVIIDEKTTLHTDAARTAPEVIDAPPGSLCEVITESGRWAYVAFATKTRGWVPIESIEKIIPEKTPEPPKFRKPKADGKSA